MNSNFDYEGALKAGYSEDEIEAFLANQPKTRNPSYETYDKEDSALTRIGKNFRNFFGNLTNPVSTGKQSSYQPEVNQKLLKKVPNFDVEGALEVGYSPETINQFLEENQPKRSKLEKGARIGAQFGLGLAENALLPYELSTIPLSSKEAQNIPYREHLGDELESLMEKKAAGQWSPEDQSLYDHITEQILDPRKSMEYTQTLDVGVRDLSEKATGVDLHPEGALEKAANWIGFIKNPKNAKDLVKLGTNSKSIRNAIMPGGKDILRGLTAGTALEMAEQNQFGPMGTMAAAIIGDLSGAGTAGIAKTITQPKKTLAKGAALLSNTKSAIRNDLKQAAEGTQFTKDLGSITNNNIVQMVQARLAGSGLTGKPLEELRKRMTKEIVQEYENIAKELGEARFQTLHEAGEVAKEGMKKVRDADKVIHQELYEAAESALRKDSKVSSEKIASAIKQLEKNLNPGSLKSTEQKAVLSVLDNIKKDIYEIIEKKAEPLILGPNGEALTRQEPLRLTKLKDASVKDLMNNKIALNDIINYEVQGGTKQLLKNLVAELDRTIISHGKENPTFARNYVAANKKFSEHAKNFRKRNIDQILRLDNPEKLMNRMNNVQGIRDLRNILNRSPEGKKIFNGLARKRLDMMIGDNMKDGITDQIKFGKMHNIIKDPNNRALLKEILSKDAYKRLINLQKHVGELAETAQKFFNASQSATAAADIALTAGILSGLASAIIGNPWGVNATIGFLGAKQLGKLIADPEFLKMTEEAIKASKKNNISLMEKISKEIVSHVEEGAIPSLLETKTLQE